MPQTTESTESQQEAKEFWEQRYAESISRSRGSAGKFLQEMASGLAPKRVLELGCSTGDDSLWLAEQGWQVTAVDISEQAVKTAERLAQEAGLSEKIHFLASNLALDDLPEGRFEFVCALYFQSYFAFPRASILQAAASRIEPGGHLLIVSHATIAPWSKLPLNDYVLPTLESELHDLALSESEWQLIEVSQRTRLAKGPEGQEAELKDNLIFARRT